MNYENWTPDLKDPDVVTDTYGDDSTTTEE